MSSTSDLNKDEKSNLNLCDGNSISTNNTWLIYGATGWIGSKILSLLTDMKENRDNSIQPSEFISTVGESQWPSILPIGNIVKANSRLQNRYDVAKELDMIKPEFVINCAGLTGRPNVDWCEDNKLEVIRVNIIGTLNLFDLCNERNIHVTNFATGCLYEYDDEHKLGSGNGFNEQDKHNFLGSFYSHTKAMIDDLVRNYNNVLNLRLRMPISDELSDRSFITKITKYAKVINVPNSMTVLHDLLPVAINMSMRKLTGVYNFTNPGTLSHNQILDLYTEYVDNTFKYTNFTIEEQNKILKAKRSNNELDVSKLCKEYPNIPSVDKSIISVFKRMNNIK